MRMDKIKVHFECDKYNYWLNFLDTSSIFFRIFVISEASFLFSLRSSAESIAFSDNCSTFLFNLIFSDVSCLISRRKSLQPVHPDDFGRLDPARRQLDPGQNEPLKIWTFWMNNFLFVNFYVRSLTLRHTRTDNIRETCNRMDFLLANLDLHSSQSPLCIFRILPFCQLSLHRHVRSFLPENVFNKNKE